MCYFACREAEDGGCLPVKQAAAKEGENCVMKSADLCRFSELSETALAVGSGM
jgi:hypothetical protein